MANARAHGFEHVIVVANDKAQCGKLIKMSRGVLDSCAWQNSKPVGQENDPWWSGANKLAIRLGIRHYFMWRFLQKVRFVVFCLRIIRGEMNSRRRFATPVGFQDCSPYLGLLKIKSRKCGRFALFKGHSLSPRANPTLTHLHKGAYPNPALAVSLSR